MYYRIRQERVEELKEGRKNTYIADLTNYSRQYLTYIFRGNKEINESAILNLINPLIQQSTKLTKMYEENGLEYMINYFFEKV